MKERGVKVIRHESMAEYYAEKRMHSDEMGFLCSTSSCAAYLHRVTPHPIPYIAIPLAAMNSAVCFPLPFAQSLSLKTGKFLE